MPWRAWGAPRKHALKPSTWSTSVRIRHGSTRSSASRAPTAIETFAWPATDSSNSNNHGAGPASIALVPLLYTSIDERSAVALRPARVLVGLRALRGCRTSAALDLHAFAVAASHDLRLFAKQALWGGPLAQHLARRGSLLPTRAFQRSTRIKPRALSNGAIHAGKQGANARDSNPRSGCPHRPANHWSHLSAWRPAGIRQPSLHRNSTVFTQYYFLGERCLRVRGVPRRHRKSRCDKRENSAQ